MARGRFEVSLAVAAAAVVVVGGGGAAATVAVVAVACLIVCFLACLFAFIRRCKSSVCLCLAQAVRSRLFLAEARTVGC